MGNEIERNDYDADGSLKVKYTSKYEYDKKGNWVRAIYFKNEIPRSVVERKYKYRMNKIFR
ncbi:MAG: hypothetical protein ACJA1N_001679 [Saprospiraceae bacterium]|jgi:hypothetical protein